MFSRFNSLPFVHDYEFILPGTDELLTFAGTCQWLRETQGICQYQAAPFLNTYAFNTGDEQEDAKTKVLLFSSARAFGLPGLFQLVGEDFDSQGHL